MIRRDRCPRSGVRPRDPVEIVTQRWLMRCRAIWTSWLGLMIGLLWVSDAFAALPDLTLQREAAARVPLPEVPEVLRARVRHVIERPTLFSHGPAEAFTGRPALYHWLLDHPDR